MAYATVGHPVQETLTKQYKVLPRGGLQHISHIGLPNGACIGWFLKGRFETLFLFSPGLYTQGFSRA